MMKNLREYLEEQINEDLIQAVLSGSRSDSGPSKVKIRPVKLKNQICYQASATEGTKIFHKNYTQGQLIEYLEKEITDHFGQFQAHNRVKQYILKEGVPVPFLEDLGVMNEKGKIITSKYDKFRQINRFLEFIEDILPQLARNREITILDFGCGKSYLTFAMYYYLRQIKGYDVNIIGLDLKTDVIEKCNKLAEKYGYEKLHFYQGDIAEYEGVSSVDMVVTLHACDTATDYALAKAVQWGAGVILSVPCCQHEVNRQIKNEMLEPVLRYGILKERISALITDGVRANLLESRGYETQLLEFIDMEHTPKNLLIRAVKTQKSAGNQKVSAKNKTERMMKELEIHPTLDRLLEIIEEGEMI